ncbi:lysozyme inhibitor LprI family protein [Geminocystis sp. NIES-3709]|uniref:lysozyme inhibitor LprI family protein n=1 Tax=Geminocystis sp. NIES-3709 TaxID=1617448 RepID=UPI00130DD44B|nr:lysozyme inhibitor LprI family protein [Geminocystis sp. NIES-3709]
MSFFISIISLSSVRSQVITPENRDWDSFIQTEESNSEMKMKESEAIEILNNRLKEVINKINLSLDLEGQNLLKKSQLTWIDYAQAKCELMADKFRGGTHQGLAYGYCFIEEQVNRIKELIAIENDHNNL